MSPSLCMLNLIHHKHCIRSLREYVQHTCTHTYTTVVILVKVNIGSVIVSFIKSETDTYLYTCTCFILPILLGSLPPFPSPLPFPMLSSPSSLLLHLPSSVLHCLSSLSPLHRSLQSSSFVWCSIWISCAGQCWPVHGSSWGLPLVCGWRLSFPSLPFPPYAVLSLLPPPSPAFLRPSLPLLSLSPTQIFAVLIVCLVFYLDLLCWTVLAGPWLFLGASSCVWLEIIRSSGKGERERDIVRAKIKFPFR